MLSKTGLSPIGIVCPLGVKNAILENRDSKTKELVELFWFPIFLCIE
jgi:hypothetical protein